MTAFERSGWRDQELSARHRLWGHNCPAADLDFLMVEFNTGLPAALVEYKHQKRRYPIDLRHPTYRALIDLADNYAPGALPFVLAWYWPMTWTFYVAPINDAAFSVYKRQCFLSERSWVKSLYHIRHLVVAANVLSKLEDVDHPGESFAPVITRPLNANREAV